MFNGFGHNLNDGDDGSFQYTNGSSNQPQRRTQSPNRQYSQFRRPCDQPNNSCPYTRTREHPRHHRTRNAPSQSNPPLNSTDNNILEPVSQPRNCHYEILGLEKTANQKDIKRAYHKQSLVWHPDKNSHRPEVAEEKFKLISEAYQVLSNEEKKLSYDTYGFEGPPTESTPSFSRENFPSETFAFSRMRPFSHPFFSATGPPSLFDFFGTDPFSFGPSPGLFNSQSSPFGRRGPGAGIDQFLGFGQRGLFPDPFEAIRSFSSPFSMFPGMSDSRTAFSSFSGGASGPTTNNSSSSSTSFVNGRYTTYIRSVDSNGNVTTEVRYG